VGLVFAERVIERGKEKGALLRVGPEILET